MIDITGSNNNKTEFRKSFPEGIFNGFVSSLYHCLECVVYFDLDVNLSIQSNIVLRIFVD